MEDSEDGAASTPRSTNLQRTKSLDTSTSDAMMIDPSAPIGRIHRVDTHTNISMHTSDGHSKKQRLSSMSEKIDITNEIHQNITDPQLNMVDIIRRKAAHVHTDARIDNTMLLSKMPQIEDMTIDDETRVTTVLHSMLFVLSIILFIFGCFGYVNFFI